MSKNVLTRNEIEDQFCTVTLQFIAMIYHYFIYRGVGFDGSSLSVFIPEKKLVKFIEDLYPDLLFESAEKVTLTVDSLADISGVRFHVLSKDNEILYQD